jgi:hypothetical protein
VEHDVWPGRCHYSGHLLGIANVDEVFLETVPSAEADVGAMRGFGREG